MTAAETRERLADFFSPCQLAVGRPNGPSELIFAVREGLDAYRDTHCLICLDFSNAFNATSRPAILRAMCPGTVLGRFARMMHAFLGPEAPLFGGPPHRPTRLPFTNAEGTPQGAPESPMAFAAALQPHLERAAAGLAPVESTCGAGMDDVYILARVEDAFPAARSLMAAVERDTGVKANLGKCACYAAPRLRAALDAHRGDIPVGTLLDAQGVEHAGVVLYGAPLGDPGFVDAFLHSKVAEFSSLADRLIERLGSGRKQLLWHAVRFSLQPSFGYWMRHCLPGETAGPARAFDDVVARAAVAALGCDPRASDVASYRLRAPTRLGGAGLRRAVDVACAAFVAGVVSTVPAFLGPAEPPAPPGGAAEPGRLARRGILDLPRVAARIGRGSFDGANAERGAPGGWTLYLGSGALLGRALQDAWAELRTRGGWDPQAAAGGHDFHALSMPASDLWPPDEGLQRAVTYDLETHRHAQFLEALPEGRVLTAAVNASQPEAMAWASATPHGCARFRDDEWAEATARSLGLPSPAVGALRGRRLGSGWDDDPYGDSLLSTQTTGDHWRTQHDDIKHGLASILRRAGLRVTVEDDSFVKGVLAANPQYIQPLYADDRRRLFAVDLAVRLPSVTNGPDEPTLIELKCIHPGTRYAGGLPSSTPRAACDRRAAQVRAERARDFAVYDGLCPRPDGTPGPFQGALAALPAGGVLGVVTGTYGEWSASLEEVLRRAARAGADRWMDRLGAPTPEAAGRVLLHLWRQELGVRTLRANARLLLARVRHAFSTELGLRAPGPAPVGAGPEAGDSGFALFAADAYWRRDPLMGYFQRGERRRAPRSCAWARARH